MGKYTQKGNVFTPVHKKPKPPEEQTQAITKHQSGPGKSFFIAAFLFIGLIAWLHHTLTHIRATASVLLSGTAGTTRPASAGTDDPGECATLMLFFYG